MSTAMSIGVGSLRAVRGTVDEDVQVCIATPLFVVLYFWPPLYNLAFPIHSFIIVFTVQ